MKDPYQTLLDYSFRLLGRKSYSEAEILEKLKKRAERRNIKEASGDFEKPIARVIQRLNELGYVDDAKILENYFEYRLRARPQGKFAFLREMRRRGIPLEKAEQEWNRRGVDELELAAVLLESKKNRFKGLPDILKKKKIAAFLAGRGFRPDIVWGVVEKLGR